MSIELFIIGLLSVVLGIFAIFDSGDVAEIVLGVLGIVLGIFVILISFPLKSEKVKPIEYPASEYNLELKVTEYQGQKDTTYVLTPKTLK